MYVFAKRFIPVRLHEINCNSLRKKAHYFECTVKEEKSVPSLMLEHSGIIGCKMMEGHRKFSIFMTVVE